MLLVLKYILAHPCIDCGETDPRVLDFDHKGVKNFTIGDALSRGPELADLQTEIALCEVRCANCHRKRHCSNSYRNQTVESLELLIASKSVSPERGSYKLIKNRVSGSHIASRTYVHRKRVTA